MKALQVSKIDHGLLRVCFQVADVKASDDTGRTFDITVETDKIALFVWIEAAGIPGRFSKNGFLQYRPQEQVQFFARGTTTVESLRRGLTVVSLKNHW